MKFVETALAGAFVIEMEPLADERGFFIRSWCENEFRRRDLASRFVQSNISYNIRKGTLRGMHYQAAPWEEAKIVRCTRGVIFDVIIDLRPTSATFKKYLSVVLTEGDWKSLYVPHGFAHGFQTLQDGTEVFYQMSEFYAPDYARGVRWDDPTFRIQWPNDERIISPKDLEYPDFDG